MIDLEAAFSEADARLDQGNYEALSERDRLLVVIWSLEANVNNGGFNQYYFNSAGDLAFAAPDALRQIGAAQMADITRRANAVFGPDGPSRSRVARQSQLQLVAPDSRDDPWDDLDRQFFAYPDDVATLLKEHLR